MENIIVYGTKRTGTSLMVQIISKNNYIINKYKSGLENNIFFENLQEYYNEGEFVNGITNENSSNYEKLNKNVIKIMNSGLVRTHLKYINRFKIILLMIRNWSDQCLSNNNLYKNHLVKNHYYKIRKKRIELKENFNFTIQEFLDDFKYDDGIEYGYYYSNLIIDIIERKYHSKILIIDFDDLISKNINIKKKLNVYNLDITEGLKLINKKQNKFSKKNTNNLKEFKKGYFNFLEKLYNSIKSGIISNDIINLIKEWLPHILNNIKNREIRIKNKYNIIYTNGLITNNKKPKMLSL